MTVADKYGACMELAQKLAHTPVGVRFKNLPDLVAQVLDVLPGYMEQWSNNKLLKNVTVNEIDYMLSVTYLKMSEIKAQDSIEQEIWEQTWD